jgi:3-hydroxy-9,10-secoandrosta-1,3,5(10)-triene-9,17-dione monooxygenase
MKHERITADVLTDAEHALVEKAKSLFPLLRERIPETDRLGRLPKDVEQALIDARMFDITTPRAYGGHQCSFAAYKEIVAELGRADPSAAWVVNLINICNYFTVTMMPRSVTDKVFSTPGGTRVCGVFSAIAEKVKKVDGGYLIEEGRWPFNSGFYHANWETIGIAVVNEKGEKIDEALAIVPIDQVRPLDDWDTIGLRGSGSTTVAVKNLFVPEDHVFPFSRMIPGDYGGPFLNDASIYRSAFVPVAAVILVFPALGIARGALDLFVERLGPRAIQYTSYLKQSDAPLTHLQVGEASAMIDTAELIIKNVLAEIEAYAAAGRYPDPKVRLRHRRDSAHASRMIWSAVDLLANASGASVAHTKSLFNRFWRDARVANLHGVLNTEANYEHFGRLLVGLEPNTYLV